MTEENNVIIITASIAEPTMNFEQVPKINRIKEYFKEAIMNSTIHALPNIFKSKRTVFKIMWFLFFFISIGFNFQFLVKCIHEYLLYETVTQIDIRTEQPGRIFYQKIFSKNFKYN